MGLTEKQKRFADEYMKDLNATQAAIRAGYSKKTADVQGARLLGNVKVFEYVRELQKKMQKKTEITRERLVEELAKIAFGNIGEAVEWSSHSVVLIPSCRLTEDVKASIAEIKESQFGISIKRHDKIRAIDLISKLLGYQDEDRRKNEDGVVIVEDVPKD